jgi:hypothetical protein
MHFIVEPEVAGGLGANTVMDRTVHPPVVTHLHYQFDGWLGDVLVESFPCFAVTKEAKEAVLAEAMTGVQFSNMEVSKSDQFDELASTGPLPDFVRLEAVGKAGHDDFGVAKDGRLVMSQRALLLLQQLQMTNALVEPFAQ